MRNANVYMHNDLAGSLLENEEGYIFQYNQEYLVNPAAKAVSLTLPLNEALLKSKTMFPFFDGLIPEGWLHLFPGMIVIVFSKIR